MSRKDVSSSSSSESDSDVEVRVKSKKSRKTRRLQKPIAWVWVLPFIAIWIGVYTQVVLKYANKLPTALTTSTEHLNKGRFIAERAYDQLNQYQAIGPKVTGSFANENVTVQFLLDQIVAVRDQVNSNVHKLEVDLQQASGAYIHWQMVNMYQGLQNVVVRLSSVSSTSSSYLLINTHFDSKPGSPGAGDPGAMVVVMLEVLRVLVTSEVPLTHPIVFLFNGAEENPLQGSHAFITQHPWAKNCKALINLDSAGSGNREIVFQSGPKNPWIMSYYQKFAVHPYANTLAEELFQSGIIPSDTDFRIFRDYGGLIGLDMAHSYNGYVYHTEYDRVEVIPIGSIQNTGDNVLALAKAFATSPYLEDPSKYAAGSVVFFDLLGQYLVLYTNSMAININYGVSIIAAVAIFFSISAMSARSKATFVGVLGRFIVTFIVHLLGLALGIVLTIGLGTYLDKLGVPMSWFTLKWVSIGLYFTTLIFGLGAPTAVLIGAWKKDKLSLSLRIQLVLNSQLLVVALLSAGITYLGYRSAYLFMLATLGYAIALIFNTITTLYRQGFAWLYVVLLVQIPVFAYFTYIGYVFICALSPMMGRFGTSTNPDLYISGLSLVIAILSLGFLVPLLNVFSRTKTILFGFLLVTVAFIGLALSPYGFPFRPATNSERFEVLHVRRVFHEADQVISKNESGYYFDLQDRKKFSAISDVFNINNVIPMADQCAEYMFCGLPVFNHRWNKAKALAQWLPSGDVILPETPSLTLVAKTVDRDFFTVRYDFVLDGPSHMGIFLGPLNGSNFTDWSFLNTMLADNWEPPYFIYFAKGKDQSPLTFYVKLQTTQLALDGSVMEIGIGGHYIGDEGEQTAESTAFFESFPAYTYVREWPSSYERWVY